MFPCTAQADMGPKPSVVIDFNDLDGKVYYATLLSKEYSTGPYSALNDSGLSYLRYQKGHDKYDINLKFVEYQDVDGFYYLQYFEECSQTNQFSWTYYPPNVFKILLYFPETDSFIISKDYYERYAFDSYFTAQVSGTSLIVEKSYNYKNEAISMIVRLVLTIVVELGIALLFGYRERKLILFIIVVNVITQIVLNLALNITNFHSSDIMFFVFYVLMEVVVFITEAVLYTWYLKKNSQIAISSSSLVIYALTANAVSFILGFGLAFLFPSNF